MFGNLLRRLGFSRREKRLTLEDLVSAGLAYGEAESGVPVSPRTALSLAAVFRAVTLISSTIASLPLHVYRRAPDGSRERADDHPVARVLERPQPWMDGRQLVEQLLASALLWGNGYALLEGLPGALTGLVWVPPERVTVDVPQDGSAVRYRLMLGVGKTVTRWAPEVLHVRGLSLDGVTGLSPIAAARRAIGLGIALEAFGSRLFRQGIRPAGVVMHPGELSDAAYERLRDTFSQAYSGLGQSHRAIILEDGATWQQLTIPPEDAQFLESRAFAVEDIARLYGVPPHLLGSSTHRTAAWGKGLAEQNLAFLTYTLTPWLRRLEGQFRKLFSTSQRSRYFAEFDTAGLLRGTTRERVQTYVLAVSNGLMSRNEVRRRENLPPVPGGDELVLGAPGVAPLGAQGNDGGRDDDEDEGDDERDDGRD